MKKFSLIVYLAFSISIGFAQTNKQELGHDDVLNWNRISQKVLSNDGKTIVYKQEPWKGDAHLFIVSSEGEKIADFVGGTSAQFSNDSRFVVFRQKPLEKVLHDLKVKKTKKEDLPLDALVIFDLKTNTYRKIENLKSFLLPEKWEGWMAYQYKSPKDTTKTEKDEKKKAPKESDKNGFPLLIKNLVTSDSILIPFVTDFQFAKEKERIFIRTSGKKGEWEAGIYAFELSSKKKHAILTHKAEIEQLTINNNGDKLAFLADTSSSKKKSYRLFYAENLGQAKLVLSSETEGMPENWEISKNGSLTFTEKAERIYLGIAPKTTERDSSILDEEWPDVDVWHWNEPELHTVQVVRRKRDLKKNYLAVYHLDRKVFLPLEKESFTGISLIDKGEADYVLASSYLPYAVQRMWESYPDYNDLFLVNVTDGSVKKIKEGIRASFGASPSGKYIYWYNAEDTTWNAYSIENSMEKQLSTGDLIQAADELNDIPNLPYPYGIAAWTEGDKDVLVYDRYDIWKLDPAGNNKPVNLTQNGRKKNLSYRLLNFDDENERIRGQRVAKAIKPDQQLFLTAHNEVSREDGYYELNLKKTGETKELFSGKFFLTRPIKAKNEEVYVFTKEDFTLFPDLLLTKNKFKKYTKLSDANPQQHEFKWGTAELVSWVSLDGKKLEGTLHKPENFDPNKKYPMIVNFYEKSSQELYRYRIPQPHRSTIDYHLYTSKGYLIFNPDVYYKEGYPGEDAFNCVMAGVAALIDRGFVNEKKIGAQGHSWGGYQVAYLATRTNLFAAIESGAPVVNMFSAYGGIRWNTGLNRSFQYEHTQSRIGKTIWESPLRYIENSPLFTMDKVTTPILIMHNDHDGYVPWYQGIEYFIALRRLGKPAWLLNYNNMDHWPTEIPEMQDFQIRMAQFFDHYLLDKPMPKWMKEGRPAVTKEYDLGY